MMHEPISEKSVYIYDRGRCEEELQLGVAVMMSTTFNHNRPYTKVTHGMQLCKRDHF